MTTLPSTVHASAVVVDGTGILVRGPSGSGKSRLAFDLILAGRSGIIPTTQLVGDDRIHLVRVGDRIIARPAPSLEGLIEIRGLGIRRCAFVGEAALGLIVDLSAGEIARMPDPAAMTTCLDGIKIPYLCVGDRMDALPLVTAFLTTSPI